MWVCERCESLNDGAVAACVVCADERDPDDVSGSSHGEHLLELTHNPKAWRVAAAGPYWIEVAAGTPEDAAAHATRVLSDSLARSQSINLVSMITRDTLSYVRAELTPYPAPGVHGSGAIAYPDSLVARARAARLVSRPDGRDLTKEEHSGRVKWYDETLGYGFVACDDRTVGDVFLPRAALADPDVLLMPEQQVLVALERIATGYQVRRVRSLPFSPDQAELS